MEMTLGEFVYEKRIAERKTVKEFARLLEISPEYVYVIENNLECPTEELMLKINNNLIFNECEANILEELQSKFKPEHLLKETIKESVGTKNLVTAIRIPIGVKFTNDEWKSVENHFKQIISVS